MLGRPAFEDNKGAQEGTGTPCCAPPKISGRLFMLLTQERLESTRSWGARPRGKKEGGNTGCGGGGGGGGVTSVGSPSPFLRSGYSLFQSCPEGPRTQ